MSQKILRADLVSAAKVEIIFDRSETIAKKQGQILETGNKVTYHKAPHEHLTNAFSKLVPHLMFATQIFEVDVFDPEFFDEYKFVDEKRFEGVIVTGIVMVGKEQDGVKLLGRKVTTDGDVTALNSPIIRLQDESTKKYPLVHLLRDHLGYVLAELKLFQDGKWGAGTQQEADMRVAS